MVNLQNLKFSQDSFNFIIKILRPKHVKNTDVQLKKSKKKEDLFNIPGQCKNIIKIFWIRKRSSFVLINGKSEWNFAQFHTNVRGRRADSSGSITAFLSTARVQTIHILQSSNKHTGGLFHVHCAHHFFHLIAGNLWFYFGCCCSCCLCFSCPESPKRSVSLNVNLLMGQQSYQPYDSSRI